MKVNFLKTLLYFWLLAGTSCRKHDDFLTIIVYPLGSKI